ncbi:MAG: ABC transporter ATP-binding protein/permease [Cyclobacteriaceae bacterium]|nr:ABC transporter ATP-binding protein/permease [Cyclobacteriaceae bacterium]
MKIYKRILDFARPISSFAIPYFIVAILAQLFGILNLGAIVPLLNILFDVKPPTIIAEDAGFFDGIKFQLKDGLFQMIEKKGATKILFYVCIGAISASLMANISRYISMRLLEKLKAKVIRNLRVALFEKILVLDLGFFTDQKKGDIISRATNDIYEVETSITNSLSSLLKDPLTVIIYFTALFLISFEMTMFTLIIIPVTGLGINFLVKKLKKSSTITQESISQITSLIDEAISGIRIIKAFRALNFVNSNFEKQAKSYERKYKNFAYRRALASPFSEVLGITVVACIIAYGGSLVLNNESGFTGDFFIMYLVMFTQVLGPIKSIANTVGGLQRGLASSRRVLEVIDTEIEIKEIENPVVVDHFNDTVEYKKVYFKYEEEFVLKNINLKINKGETVALVGPSGGGKSTFVDLLPRFYDVSEGEICIDGNTLKEVEIDSLRKQIGIVSQESILFNDTVFNNIAFGVENATEEEVIHAAKIANAHDFIMNLSDGYQTLVGERGLKLSGGQRQRVSIARAIFKNPPILILDEATSALDTASEKLVQEALENLMKNRTSIVIAHRLSTIQNADKIVVIKAGEIVEKGTHAELIKLNGVYTKLNKMQEL